MKYPVELYLRIVWFIGSSRRGGLDSSRTISYSLLWELTALATNFFPSDVFTPLNRLSGYGSERVSMILSI